ncbi:tryptophan synthase subunit alpha [Limibacter armeniacum]|uniref:tryptophan synthase subunit alpha n=1 Tax=Limibacter armeniacum TaxID=466084 RepID=UPI002FE64AA2
MNRIDRLFQEKQHDILNVYFTAGYPQLEDTMHIITALDKAGADLIEIGMPYSDPVADGPTIQASNQTALDNGMTIHKLFEQLKTLRQKSDIPVVLMGYVNPVVQYGLERFCMACAEVGIDGVILPDLPMQEYVEEYKTVFEKHGLHNVFLISPQTSEERIRQIDENSSGFIYMVSSSSITGAKTDITEGQRAYFKRVEDMQLKNPRLIGFGISNHETFKEACSSASGAIIGSAFIKLLADSKDLEGDINRFVKSVKEGK